MPKKPLNTSLSVSQHLGSLHYLPGHYFADAASEWCIVFKYLLFPSAVIAASFAPCPATVIIPFLQHYNQTDLTCCMFHAYHHSCQPSFLL